MTALIRYDRDTASGDQIAEHLRACDSEFNPPLSQRVEIGAYARKISAQATRFEAWSDDALIGLLALYCNDTSARIAYITSVSVLGDWTGRGVARSLMVRCIDHAAAVGMLSMQLEVAQTSVRAVRLYQSHGFSIQSGGEGLILTMRRPLAPA